MKSEIQILEVYIELTDKLLSDEQYEAAKTVSSDLRNYFAKVKKAILEEPAETPVEPKAKKAKNEA